MKRILIAATVVFALASCKKEWTCECNVLGAKVSVKTEKMTKAEAKEECEDNSNGACKIK